MAYLASVDGKEYRVEVQPVGGDLYKVILDDEKEILLDTRKHGCCIYSVLNGGESYEVDVDEKTKGGYSVLVKGEHFHIDIIDEMQKKLLSIMGEGAGTATGEVSTAMPGQVVKVLVKEGQMVKQGEPLVILEAMKMENEFKATVDGIVKAIKVKEGETVEANSVLVELEPQE